MRGRGLQKFEANAQEMLIWAKKRGSSDLAQGSRIGFPFWSNPILFPRAVSDCVFSTLKMNFTPSEYEF